MSNYTTYRTQRGSTGITWNSFSYLYQNKFCGNTYWRCRNRRCCGRGKVTNGTFTETQDHSICYPQSTNDETRGSRVLDLEEPTIDSIRISGDELYPPTSNTTDDRDKKVGEGLPTTSTRRKVVRVERDSSDSSNDEEVWKIMHRRSSGKVPKVEEGISDSEEGLQVKVQSLEKTLNTFRAEVDMKMKIMEQILTTRNEQFAVQKKLLEREHALYQTVLGHWRNTGELAAKGLSLHFSQDVDTLNDDEMDPDEDDLLGSKTSSTAARRARRKRLRAKRLRTELQQPKKLCGDDVDVQLIFSEDEDQRMEVDVKGCGGSDDDYANEPSSAGYKQRHSDNPIWRKFVRMEQGKSALCKICGDEGRERVLRTKGGSTTGLHAHLRSIHRLVIVGNDINDIPQDGITETQRRRLVALRKLRTSTGRFTPRKPRSWVWNYFLKDGSRELATCNLCQYSGKTKTVDTSGGSTSGLHAHLKCKHGITTESHRSDEQKSKDTTNTTGEEFAYNTEVVEREILVEDTENISSISPTEQNDPSGDGLERKVFVNYYAEEGGKRGEKSSNPVWSYFLREETGKSALCKLCDDGGVQKIIKTHDSSTSPLRRHLKIKHKIECGGGPVSEPRSVASKSSRMSTPVTGSCVYSEVFTAEDWAEIWDYEIKVFKPKWTMAMTNIIRNQGYPCNFKPSHVGIKENGGQPFIRLSGGCNVNRGKCVCKSRYKLTVFNQPERGQEVKISLEANGSYDHSEIPVAVSDEKETTVDVSAEDWEKVWDYDKMTFKQSWTIFMSTLFREQGLLCVYKPSQTIVSEGNEPFLMTHGGCSVSNDNCKARFKITVLEPPIDKEGVKVNIRIRGTQSHSQIITSELTITDV